MYYFLQTLSNIHVVRAVPLERDLSWTFTPKVAKTIPSLYDGEIVARINSDDRRISSWFPFFLLQIDFFESGFLIVFVFFFQVDFFLNLLERNNFEILLRNHPSNGF